MDVTAHEEAFILSFQCLSQKDAKWCSPGATSKMLQPNLCGCSSLQVRNEKGMIGEKVLLDGEDLYTCGVPSGLEDRYYRYRIDSYNEGKVCTFNLTYIP